MGARAGGGESTGDGDENDLLGLELCSMGAGHVSSCSFDRRCHSRRVGLQESRRGSVEGIHVPLLAAKAMGVPH